MTAKMTPQEMSAKAAELKPAWARDYIRQLEALTRDLGRRLQEAYGGNGQAPSTAMAADDAETEPAPPEITWPDGITPPGEGYAVIRVLDGTANMEPVADLPDHAEIVFGGFFQAHFGDHELTAGARVLIIEGDGPLVIRSVDPGTIIIARG